MKLQLEMRSHRIPRLDTPLLPLQQRVIFVDWHGVTSQDVFWASIVQNETHRHHKHLKYSVADLFQNKKDMVARWMRGAATYQDVVRTLDLSKSSLCDPTYLERRLLSDCARMEVNQKLLLELRDIKRHYVVLATDNMDCFARVVDRIPWIRQTFDAVLCSCEMGVTKNDSIYGFFEPWLTTHSLTFQDAVLIDDSRSNCDGFRKLGGEAILYEELTSALDQLKSFVAGVSHD